MPTKIDFTDLTVLDSMSENDLRIVAEFADNDDAANKAMEILRVKYDPTYDWDLDMDGLVNTQKERDFKPTDNNEDLPF